MSERLPSNRDLSALATLLVTHEHSMKAADAEAVRRCYQYLVEQRQRNIAGLRRALRARVELKAPRP